MQPMAFVIEYDKGKTVTPPFSNYTVVMFVQGYVTVFCVSVMQVVKGATKAATRNGVPQEKDTWGAVSGKLALCLVCCLGWHLVYVNSANRLCYNKNIRVIGVLLGSSLPIVGGGGTMKKFRKIDLLILILKLLVHLIDWFH